MSILMKMNKLIFASSLILISLVILIKNIPELSYKSDLVVEGSYYNLEIGMEKHEVYSKLGALLRQMDNDTIHFRSLVVSEAIAGEVLVPHGSNLLIQTRLLSTEFELYQDSDFWKFYLEGNFRHSIALTFCDQSLCKIYYHYQRFELP